MLDRWTTRHELHGERLGNARGHIGLHREAVGEMAFVGLGPEVRFAGGFNQAGGDAHTVVLAAHAALEQVVGAERLADLARPLAGALEHHAGPSRHDADAPATPLAELRDHLLGQPVCEVLLRRHVAQIGEREHREPHPRRAGWGLVTIGQRLPDEPVSTPRQRLHETRVIRVVAEGGPQPFDRGVEAVLEVDERAVGPEPALQLVAGDHVTRALEHQPQDLERLLLQADGGAVLVQLTRPDVELERSEAQQPGCLRRRCVHVSRFPDHHDAPKSAVWKAPDLSVTPRGRGLSPTCHLVSPGSRR